MVLFLVCGIGDSGIGGGGAVLGPLFLLCFRDFRRCAVEVGTQAALRSKHTTSPERRHRCPLPSVHRRRYRKKKDLTRKRTSTPPPPIAGTTWRCACSTDSVLGLRRSSSPEAEQLGLPRPMAISRKQSGSWRTSRRRDSGRARQRSDLHHSAEALRHETGRRGREGCHTPREEDVVGLPLPPRR